MIPIIAGTVRDAVRLEWLDSKWQQKKENGKIFQKELTPEERMINQFQEDIQKMRENNDMASVRSKLKSGEELTAEEIAYIQKNAPELYREYQEIEAEKEAYERQLRNCKTKEEVDRLKINKMNGILSQARSVLNNPNIPKSAKLGLAEKFLMKTTGIGKVHLEFVKSGKYAALPTEEEIAEEKHEEAEETRQMAEALAPDEAAETADTADAADAGKTADAGKAADTADAADTGKTADAGKAADTAETADTADAADTVETADVVGAADAGKAVDMAETADAGKAVDMAETADAEKTVDAEKKTDIADAAEMLEHIKAGEAKTQKVPKSGQMTEKTAQRSSRMKADADGGQEEDIFVQVRRELVDFIRKNGAGGAGLEYLMKDHDLKIKKNN